VHRSSPTCTGLEFLSPGSSTCLAIWSALNQLLAHTVWKREGTHRLPAPRRKAAPS
jgi:hypothetical protein